MAGKNTRSLQPQSIIDPFPQRTPTTMQFNHYANNGRQVQPVPHPSQTSDDYATAFTDPSQHPSMTYAAVTPGPQLPAGNMSHQTNLPPQYPYSPYVPPNTQAVGEDHRPYFATSSQGTPLEHYAAPSSPTSSYATPSGHMSPQAHRHAHHHHHHHHHPQQFIPTPSQTYQVYSSAPSSSSARSRSSVEPYYHMSPNPQHVAPSPAHGIGRSTHPGNFSNVAGERYPCDLCDRSFTRLHDRRRHYETVHAPSPVLHKCRFCRKDFSRSDSLKRHVDNGCDEMHR